MGLARTPQSSKAYRVSGQLGIELLWPVWAGTRTHVAIGRAQKQSPSGEFMRVEKS
jgi:hypothetical protein